MESTRRVRVVFKDDDVLSEAQKSGGLTRSWVLLKINEDKTISDVVSHLLRTFQLQHSCPHGLLLSIDGFVLPPFESTCILKDKDIIRVKKKVYDLAIQGNNITALVEKPKALEKNPVNSGVLLLANEEFEKEKGGYESDEPEEEDEEPLKDLEGTSGGKDVSKKRKRKDAEECQDLKKKKKKRKKRSEASDNVANDVHTEKIRSHQDGVRTEEQSLPDEANKSDFKDTENDENNRDMMRNEYPEENGKENEEAVLAPAEPKKLSRNTKRKYAQRKLKKEMRKIQKKNEDQQEGLEKKKKNRRKAKRNEVDCQSKEQKRWRKNQVNTEGNEVDGQPKGLLHWKQLSGSNTSKTSDECQQHTQTTVLPEHQCQNGKVHDEPTANGEVYKQPIQNGKEHKQPKQHGSTSELSNESAEEGEVVPFHKQRTQNGKEHKQPNQHGDMSELSNEFAEEAEVVPIVVRPGHIRFEPQEKEHDDGQNQVPAVCFNDSTLQWNGITSKKKGQKWGREKNTFLPRNESQDSGKGFSEISSNEKEKLSHGEIDFDKFPPLVDVPKEGDFIAYRIVELSSSWTPELSPYRVGEVSWVNTETRQTLLMPVPEYPVVFKKLDEEDEFPNQPDNSLYKEDGSLEIDLPSLVDVRLIKGGKTGPRNESASHNRKGPVANENAANPDLPTSNDNHTRTVTPDHGESKNGKQTQSVTTDKGVNAWEEISATLNAKKAQLLQENSGSKESSGKKSWSYKTLRGSALGPTMAFLRSKNEL